jgi:hypothetical protein
VALAFGARARLRHEFPRVSGDSRFRSLRRVATAAERRSGDRPGSLADDRPLLHSVDVHGRGDADPHAALAPLDRRGRTGCRSIQAAAALGSIAGTFLAGFVLISAFGTRRIVAGVAATLLVLAAAPRPRWLRRRLLELGAILAAIVTTGWTSYSPCLRESNYYCIRVVDNSLPTSSRSRTGSTSRTSSTASTSTSSAPSFAGCGSRFPTSR